ncbi:hypothetical protein ACFV2N_33875 [Streptomyces sp. NPDC059680]
MPDAAPAGASALTAPGNRSSTDQGASAHAMSGRTPVTDPIAIAA